MAVWLSSTKSRSRKLDKYENVILKWLREHPDLSSVQVFDWSDEKYSKLKVGKSTIRRYVREIR